MTLPEGAGLEPDALVAALRQAVGHDRVLSGADSEPYLTDWRGRYQGKARAVVLPASTEEVAEVVRLCAAAGVPVVPQGGNTGLVGGATPDGSGQAVLVSLKRMNRVLEMDAGNSTALVEAGCLLADVQTAASVAGRQFPLSLAAEGSCTVGGNIASNAGGVHVLRYGPMRDLVLGLEVVLPDGAVWDGLRALRKDNTGIDLKQVFIGSEGTLGIVTRAVLKLFPAVEARAAAWVGVESPAAAVALFCKTQARFGARLEAFELLGRNVLNVLFRQFPEARDPLPNAPWAVLMELCDGDGPEGLHDALAEGLAEWADVGALSDAVLAQSEAQRRQLWWLREHAPEAEKREGISIKHDISLPVSRLPQFLAEIEPEVQAAYPGVDLVIFGHVGDGNLHFNLRMCDSGANAAFLSRQSEVNQRVFDRVAALGGSLSAEHGIGQLRRLQLPRYRSSVELQLQRAIKRAIDPRNLMNPGKLYPDL